MTEDEKMVHFMAAAIPILANKKVNSLHAIKHKNKDNPKQTYQSLAIESKLLAEAMVFQLSKNDRIEHKTKQQEKIDNLLGLLDVADAVSGEVIKHVFADSDDKMTVTNYEGIVVSNAFAKSEKFVKEIESKTESGPDHSKPKFKWWPF